MERINKAYDMTQEAQEKYNKKPSYVHKSTI